MGAVGQLDLLYFYLLVRSRPKGSLKRIGVLWSVNEKLIVSIEVTFLRGRQIRPLILHMLLVLLQRNVDGASLRCLNEQQNVILTRATLVIFLFVYIYKVLLDNIAMLKIGLVLLELLSELFYLGETRIEVSLGLFPLLFNLILPVKFLLHFFYLPLEFFIFLIPLLLLFTKELRVGIFLEV